MLGSCHSPSSMLPSSHKAMPLSTPFIGSPVITPPAGVWLGKFNIPKKKCRLSVTSVLAEVDEDWKAFQAQYMPKPQADPKTVASIILGGGEGTRLFPLTSQRAKPAVPIGGCYRLIDVPMSNCINSGIKKMYVLTQFNSHSINRHIAQTYNLGNGLAFVDCFVEVLAATQTPGESGKKWFQGTADAVRQFMWLFEHARLRDVENILILSGDHLYRMDYMDFVQKHMDSGADITVSCVPVNESSASNFGLVKIDDRGYITEFLEKPKGESLKSMQVDTSFFGLPTQEALENPYIASMGIYVFKREVLQKLLCDTYPTANDFGSEIIPTAANKYDVQAYLFDDYWEDIGTIKLFFDANMALTDESPKFQFFDPDKPIYTSPKFLPPSKIENCMVKNSIISHGCFLRDCRIEHSIVGDRSKVEFGAELKDTMMMGADYYETNAEILNIITRDQVPIGVGRDTKITKCIIDKNARIGKNVIIANKDDVEEADRSSEGFYIRSGITVIMKNSTIKDGTIIGQ